MRKNLVLPLLCASLLLAQDLPPDIVPPFVITTERVVVPVTVFDREGGYVNGLNAGQFHLYDNGKEQNIEVDVAYEPISLVIAIEASSHVEGILPQVQKIGNLISPLVIGDQGEAAVVAFDSRVRMLQDFTSNPDLITQAVKKITPGSNQNRIIDAAVESARMLSHRPQNRRRIILMISETRDLGSESRAREALIDLQLGNIVLYGVDMSRFLSTLTAPPNEPRPFSQPPTAYTLPGGVPSTPTTVAQTYGGNGGRAEFMPLMIELLKDVKYIFKDNPIELFTKGTGGGEFPFYKQRGLEEAIGKIGEELHSEYVISYSPNNKLEGGFHQILVEVEGRLDVKKVLTRPGYWLAAKPG
ncbi:MAG: VWA domain-containing protein [Acidobacteriia bacterium]|nr:VWA domain-containing protein [Terriglobia bacterium]MBV8903364.1 VWA domain-containing protein [Terriglobia bacterium]MBV9744911.1 VWA domain-containing protein [Terriglobia bacterium]